jgi:hypothetical protein
MSLGHISSEEPNGIRHTDCIFPQVADRESHLIREIRFPVTTIARKYVDMLLVMMVVFWRNDKFLSESEA